MRVNLINIQNLLNNSLGIFIIAAILTATIFAITPSPQPVLNDRDAADAYSYIQIANGNINEVMRPFSGRFLHPFFARWISDMFAISLYQSFFAIAVVSLFLFFAIALLMLKKLTLPYFLIAPLLFLPLFPRMLHNIFLPDIFYIFLTAAFFLFLFYKMEGASLLALFLLFLTRESTILLGLVYFVFYIVRKNKILSLAVFLVILISVFTVNQASKLGTPNAHNLGGVSYLAFKAPYHFLHNLFGIKLWTNTLAQSDCNSVAALHLPKWNIFGSIRAIGFCNFNPLIPMDTMVTLTTIFGVMPSLTFYFMKRKWKYITRESPSWLVAAFWYGLAIFIVGVVMTTGPQRFLAYGWPALLLAVPFLMHQFLAMDKMFIIKFSIIHIFVAWLPVFALAAYGYIGGSLLTIALALAAHTYALTLVKKYGIPITHNA